MISSKKPIVSESRVVMGPYRLSYAHLFQPYSPDGDTNKARYSTVILIPKTDTVAVDAINKAVEVAKQRGVVNKWHGKTPAKLDLPLRDGDEKDGEDFHDCYYLNAKCKTRPGVVDKYRATIMDEEEVYSGMYAVVSVTFFPFDNSGNKGVACGLNNVMKVADGERLGGRMSAEADFAEVQLDDDDDL